MRDFRWLFMKYSWMCVIALPLMLFSCSNANVAQKKGEQSMAIGEYYNASIQFKKSYSATPAKDKAKRAERAFLLGESYRSFGSSTKAMAAYQNAVRYKYPDSTALYYLGQQQLRCGQYKQAAESFAAYLERDPDNALAKAGLESARLAPEWKENPNLYQVKKETVFNSRRSDFCPMFVNAEADQIVFSTTRDDTEGDDISGITGVKFADLFFSKKNEQGKWSSPEPIEGGVNTEYDEGVSCMSPDGKTMYFTRCSSDPDYPRFAEIWKTTRSDASWGSPTKCDISNDTLSSFAHPAISPDGQWLYFVSDMPEGEGGLDIWRTRITSAGFAGIENVGPEINTPGDEAFPVFKPTGELFFSSDGHPGMGGLDILKATPKYEDDGPGYGDNDEPLGAPVSWTVENQGYPLNSSADDFGMTFEGVHSRGYFSSNRADGKGFDHIYSFELPEIVQSVTGWVYEKDGYELPEALVYMVGNDGTNEKLSVRGDGSFTQVIKPGVEYLFLGTCKGYLNVKNELKVEPSEDSEEYVLQFPLPPINVPVLIDNIFYGFDSADLTPESTVSLDKLVTLLNDNSNVTIELGAHCDYRGVDIYNLDLSQRRAQSVVKYLVEHGISKERLTAVGYGETQPKVVTRKLASQHDFLQEGDILTEEFITHLTEEQQEICNALNRRTVFKVLRTTYQEQKSEEQQKTEN